MLLEWVHRERGGGTQREPLGTGLGQQRVGFGKSPPPLYHELSTAFPHTTLSAWLEADTLEIILLWDMESQIQKKNCHLSKDTALMLKSGGFLVRIQINPLYHEEILDSLYLGKSNNKLFRGIEFGILVGVGLLF